MAGFERNSRVRRWKHIYAGGEKTRGRDVTTWKKPMKTRTRSSCRIALLLACFGFLPTTQAVITDPEGYFPGWNTAEGQSALFSLTTGLYNTALGGAALYSNTAGNGNTAAGLNSLFHNTVGNSNTALGAAALYFTTTGEFNTATGTAALRSNITGSGNTANGYHALYFNTGSQNTANGHLALVSNRGGLQNTATGALALASNTTGSCNTANGNSALDSNTTGGSNTATGYLALASNTTGHANTANGDRALANNTIGSANTAVGGTTGFFGNQAALGRNTTGSDNTAIGNAALYSNTTGGSNTAVGEGALFYSTSVNNTALGAEAGLGVTTANNVTCIAASGQNVSNSCYIGRIWNRPGGSQAVYVNSFGKLGQMVSSRRFKDNIEPIGQASEIIYGLNPVSFRYKAEIEPSRPLSFGLIAEEVEQINPDLVTQGSDGEVNSVRYEAVNAMLLNEFLKEHRKNEEQAETIADLKSAMAQQQKQLEALTASLQKVSAQIQIGKVVSKIVRNNP
jgi:hypothetical protein